MLNNQKICCIITARKNSKGLVGKNLKKINGRPLIYFSIDAAKNSKHVDKVFFNSDCKKMIKIAKKYGTTTNFIRPKNLSQSTTKSVDVLLHHINTDSLENEYQYILLLEPTSPLTTSADIDNAIKKLIRLKDKANSLVSVSESTTPSSFLSFYKNKYLLKITGKKSFYTTRRQDFPKRYYIDGSLYLTKIKSLKKFKSFIQDKTTFITLERYKNFQIDDFLDYKIVKFLYNQFSKSK